MDFERNDRMRERFGRKGKKASKKAKAELLRNKKLVKKYYFLKPAPMFKPKRNRRLPKYDYSYIQWYGWPDGWNVAFADMFLDELGAEIKRTGQKDFAIFQIKEKYGQMRCYTSGTSRKANDIIYKYGHISENVCWTCGKPDVPMINDGWMHPVCFECYKKAEKRREKYFAKYNIDYIPKTDEELKERYEHFIDEDPDENGEYKIADSYKIRHLEDGKTVDEVYDLRETANKVRERWERRKANYKKRIIKRKAIERG